MTSYELLDFYERVLGKIEELNVYTQELTKLISSVNMERDMLLNTIYIGALNSSNVIHEADQRKNNIINLMQQFAMDFDILNNHGKLIQIVSEIKYIFNDSPVVLEEEKDKITELLNNYSNLTSIIMNYLKTRKNDAIVELINTALITVSQYDKFIESYKSIKNFMLKTENKVEEKDDEKIFKIHFYDEHLDPEYFVLNIHSINESYEIMCQILNVSFNEYPLKVLKIESGSLLGKFLGYDPVIESLSYLAKKIIELIFNKFTFEGKVLRNRQLYALLNEDLELRAKYKELGFESNLGEEEFTKYHYQLVESIGKLIGQTTKVKINDEEFCLESHLKQKYLTESSVLLIKDSNIQKDSQQNTEKKD